MKDWLARWGWTLAKLLLAAAIIGFVGRRFYLDLQRPELSELTFRPGWLLLSAILYAAFLAFALFFWYRLLKTFRQPASLVPVIRAYAISQLGKYLPGKAWSLALRAAGVRRIGVKFGIGLMSALYEVLTVMASGALLAAVLFAIRPPNLPGLSWHPVLIGLALLVVCGVFLWPAVFNFLAGRLIRKMHQDVDLNVTRLHFGTLAQGLLITSCGWFVFGIGLWAVLQSVLPVPVELTLDRLIGYVAGLGLAYVAGFLALVVPGGIGVREFFLLHILSGEGPEAVIAAAVLLMRLVWTATELVAAGILYFIPVKPQTPLPSPPEPSQ